MQVTSLGRLRNYDVSAILFYDVDGVRLYKSLYKL